MFRKRRRLGYFANEQRESAVLYSVKFWVKRVPLLSREGQVTELRLSQKLELKIFYFGVCSFLLFRSLRCTTGIVFQRVKYKLAMIVCMDWRQFTWSMTVMQFLVSPASDISCLLTPGHCSCQGRRQHWGWGVLRSPASHTSGEKSASCLSNRNALTSGVRSTSQDPAVWLGLTARLRTI